jgi:cyclic pyranopterin phosphate synthase
VIAIYTDGAYNPIRNQGGWAAIVLEGGRKQVFSGAIKGATSNRMEITAALEGILKTPPQSEVVVHTDSQYLYGTMTRNWKRQANKDLWERLDEAVRERRVSWVWMEQADSDPLHKEAHNLATSLTGNGGNHEKQTPLPTIGELSHVDENGRPRMVDVSEKPDTEREAVARGTVRMQPATLERIKKGEMAKGDVLPVAQLAGIMAAKQTPYLIPLCHNIFLGQVKIDFKINDAESAIEITATVKSTGKTGVEMEALTATAVTALTIYDMCKAIDRGMRIESIRLVRKSGGKSGIISLE